jgi:hypothetical protein
MLLATIQASALAAGQNRAQPAGHPITISAQPDGRFVVDAVNVPVTDVITAVATKAGLAVSTVGQIPRSAVTVSYQNRWPEDILTDLMKTAGINYVMTGGPDGHLFMAMFGSKPGLSSSRPEPVAPAPVPVPVAEPAIVAVAAPEPTAPEKEPEPEPSTKPAQGPAEWPAGIAPATSGAVRLPQTVEELFREVNGSAPVTLPADVTPNVGPPKTRPEDFEPVNPPNAGAGAVAGVARPGAIAMPTRPAAAAANPNGAAAAPAPDMMQAPKTIQIPGPVVVEFPAPKKPS